MSGGEKQAVVFDFDDTLVYTNEIFDAAREDLYRLLAEAGVNRRQEIAAYLSTKDLDNVRRRGFLAADCFPLAMRQTAACFLPRRPDVAAAAEEAGWAVYRKKPRLAPDAEAVLAELSRDFLLLLWTQAEPYIQQPRLAQSGLLPYFTDVEICRCKDAPGLLAFLRRNRAAAGSWLVGNSLRSDINPALQAGLRAVHISHPVWEYETETPVGTYYTIDALRQLPDLLKG
ncbi:MAG: HAD family hydrolase [Firmicutes bacterium]|nr:HAD family hydrolase [Bacillota bacterium]